MVLVSAVLGTALAAVGTEADAAERVEAEEADALPPRHTNPGFGLGLTGLGAASFPHPRYGLLLDLRKEEGIGRRLQFNAVLSAGLTRPQNTLAVVNWAGRAGAWTTEGFGSVSRWVARGSDDGSRPYRDMAAFFGYFGLALSYVAVPVAIIVSPAASVGHLIGGATVSWHTSPTAPNVYVEGGFGGLLFGHPANGAPGAGCGPLLGAGTQVGRQTVGVRLLVSPPGMNVAADGHTDLVWTGSLVLGL